MTYPKINLTITTFDRRFLFQKTMDSFLDTCQDLDLINRWLIGDDGSSRQDIVWMQKKYPFLTIYKNPNIGQASNLNHLFSKVETEWFFHMEDDWLFLKKDNYIRKLFDIVLEDLSIKNATLRFWKGEDIRTTITGIKYFVHSYKPISKFRNGLLPKEQQKQRQESNCNWYGYTLNPSLQHKPTIDLLGLYNESFNFRQRIWDKPIAKKYLKMGLKTANILDNYIEHIGEGNSAYGVRRRS